MQDPAGLRMSTAKVLWLLAKGEKFDPLTFALNLDKTYGGFSYNEVGPVTMYQITDPELVHEVLIEKANKFHKADRLKNALKSFAGNGLLLSEGDFWKRQRKLAQPAFHMKRIESYAQAMVEHTLQMLESWKNGETRFLDREMMKVTLSIVCKTLFDADVSGDAERVGVLLTEVLEESNEKINAPFELPDWIPSPKRNHRKAVLAELDGIIQGFIDERKRSGEDKGDLLSMLLEARDEDGNGMDAKQLRDEAMTLFIAGHETTAMALAWAWYLLTTHPETMKKLQQEVDMVLQGRTPTLQDLANLPYTDMVLKETLRLYPPASGVTRQATEDVQIGGYTIKKGVMISVSSFAMHRSQRLFENPDAFDPERFSKENESKIPRYAYLPFGGGPRVCIGNMFAIMEARLILAAVAQRYDLTLEAGQDVTMQQLLTIRPKNGIRMKLKARQTIPVPEAV